jgi:ankyrin repeat protein
LFQSRKLFTSETGDHIKSLIGKGAKINTTNSDEATPLIVHTQQNNIEIVKELIQHRANVDLQDRYGYSALNVAAKGGNLELVQLLVKHGAILDLKECVVSSSSPCARLYCSKRSQVLDLSIWVISLGS